MTDTDPSAALDKIRKSHRQHVSENFPAPGICVSRCAERYPCSSARLLAAVDAVLAKHQPGRFALLGALCAEHDAYRMFSITSNEADRVAACPDCSVSVARLCDCCGSQWPCGHVQAISRELLRPEGASG